MKVVFTHTDFRIYWPARLSALNKYLNDRNINLEIIEIAGGGSNYGFAGSLSEHPPNWHILFPGRKIEDINPVYSSNALKRKLDEIMPDIVFAGAIAFPSGASAVKWASERNRKVVIFDNARLKDVPRPEIVNFIKRKIYSSVDAILCPAPAWNQTFNFFGFSNDQIFYGVNVIDNNFWNENVHDKPDNLPEDYILCVGRQVIKKNALFLLKAYREYAESVPDPKALVLVGEGPRRRILQGFVKEAALRKVYFIPFSSQEQLRKYYQNASFFILPSRYGETWGLSVNEAMASGLPVLVSNETGCASTLLVQGNNGYTFSPEHVEELSGLLTMMHKKSRFELTEMGKASLKIINDWGLERFCNGVYDTIKFVAERKKVDADLLGRIILELWKGRYRPT
jgi:1,2-diacylglycerol 3-alpha-glucosyltransferase